MPRQDGSRGGCFRRSPFEALCIDKHQLVGVLTGAQAASRGRVERDHLDRRAQGVQHRLASLALDDQILRDHVHDVRVIETGRDRQTPRGLPGLSHDLEEQAVDRVVL